MQLGPDERLDAEQVAPDGTIVRATEGLPLTEKGEFLMCCHREMVATILRGQDAIRAASPRSTSPAASACSTTATCAA